jgi:hypothetical protein
MSRVRNVFTVTLALVFALTLAAGVPDAAPADSDTGTDVVVIGKVQFHDFHIS